ncbi:leucine-rich repeat domain-containing protein [Simiduia curdlanivorans]|uniref:Leucine-rich repeat domain-containing protein n=1 Tax=Simiduia curdlanivorans TaxID=1492769 RepID=A0ABV8V6B2_9GAMM|nr:leucine-rich repeat domain-containing protein [Simiduia curdlanivorans]MDN3640755.1 leucine-rich repeat domain-containing protein [Simiduia curdlanivorans]
MMRIKTSNWRTYFLSLCLSCLANISQATNIQVVDTALQACLNKQAKANNWSQPAQFTEISCHGEGVKSLEGLLQFKNLETLSLYNNKLAQIDIDLRNLSKLKTLNLARNHLTTVDISALNQLENLYLFANQLTTLDLSGLPKLAVLKANNNALTHFSYANTPKLKKIYIFNNQLETINIYDLPALQYMDCRENPMPDELYDQMDQTDNVTFLHDGNADDW